MHHVPCVLQECVDFLLNSFLSHLSEALLYGISMLSIVKNQNDITSSVKLNYQADNIVKGRSQGYTPPRNVTHISYWLMYNRQSMQALSTISGNYSKKIDGSASRAIKMTWIGH